MRLDRPHPGEAAPDQSVRCAPRESATTPRPTTAWECRKPHWRHAEFNKSGLRRLSQKYNIARHSGARGLGKDRNATRFRLKGARRAPLGLDRKFASSHCRLLFKDIALMDAAACAEEFRRRLDAAADAAESALDALLAAAPLPGEIRRPARLLEAMRYSSLGGGKRLRPFLVIEAARLFGVVGDAALRTACALEMIHCYSLVHDDLPAMDDDDLRRGRPTTHKAFDEATAILAGDGLLTYAFDVVADPQTHADAGVRAALVLAMARAAGLGGMVGGQALDLAAETAATPLTLEATLQMQAMKTGALLRFAVDAGGILGGASASQARALTRYGEALGAAFQIADDILDAEGDSAALGKRAGKDAERGKATLVGLLGLDAARARRDALVAEATAALRETGLGEATGVLAEAARFVAARRN
ncbi:Polyprenyl synthetase [Methylocystis sp. SC2]|nr:Polyprenyl synthetase [Methylocystis sp. SC2]